MNTITSITIRKYQIQDLSPVVRLFTDSVHELTAGAYDETQRYAWASRTPHLDVWRARLDSLETLVAEEGDDLGTIPPPPGAAGYGAPRYPSATGVSAFCASRVNTSSGGNTGLRFRVISKN